MNNDNDYEHEPEPDHEHEFFIRASSFCDLCHLSLSGLSALCSLLQSSNREIQQSPDATLGKMLSKEETTTLRSDEKVSEVRASSSKFVRCVTERT